MKNNRLCKLSRELGMSNCGEAPSIKIVIENVNSMTENTNKKYTHKKILTSALVAVLILSIAGLTVIAARLGWHNKLVEYFNNPTMEEMDMLSESFDAPMISKTDNGYTVNVLNTLADKHGIYVLYELVLPTERKMSFLEAEEYMKEVIGGVFVEESNPEGYIGIGIESEKILDVRDNVITLCNYVGMNGEILNKQKISLTVRHNRYIEMEDDANTFVSGNTDYFPSEHKSVIKKAIDGDFEIEISWDFEYRNIGKSYFVDKKLDINGVNNNVLKTVDVSPISIWITAEGEDVQSAMEPIIKFKNGNEIKYSNRKDENAYGMFANNQTGDNRLGITTLGYVFDRITDISTIESIIIGNLTIEVDV